jgi:hypothetical protein
MLRRVCFTAVLSAAALLLSACNSTVNGGGTFSAVPFLDGFSDGDAILAVASTIKTDQETINIRSSGNFRNAANGVSFSFRLRGSDPIGGEVLSAAVSTAAGTMSEPGCAFFAGEFSNARGLGAGSGLVIGAVVTNGDETILILLALTDSDLYGFAGVQTKGSLRLPRVESECGIG